MRPIDPRTPLEITLEKIKRRTKQGYGVGEGDNYKPAWLAHQLSSRGNKYLVPLNNRRCVHLYSELEYRIFRKIRRMNPKPKQIREQVPLNILETDEICRELKIKHPRKPHSKDWHQFSTDLVVDWDFGAAIRREPIHIKYSKELDIPRNVLKREVERRVWERHHLELKVLTEDFITKTEWLNIRWFHEDRRFVQEISDKCLRQIKEALEEELRSPQPFLEVTGSVAERLRIGHSVVVTAARHLMSLMRVESTDDEPIYRSRGIYLPS